MQRIVNFWATIETMTSHLFLQNRMKICRVFNISLMRQLAPISPSRDKLQLWQLFCCETTWGVLDWRIMLRGGSYPSLAVKRKLVTAARNTTRVARNAGYLLVRHWNLFLARSKSHIWATGYKVFDTRIRGIMLRELDLTSNQVG